MIFKVTFIPQDNPMIRMEERLRMRSSRTLWIYLTAIILSHINSNLLGMFHGRNLWNSIPV
jgi:hypothetical protein